MEINQMPSYFILFYLKADAFFPQEWAGWISLFVSLNTPYLAIYIFARHMNINIYLMANNWTAWKAVVVVVVLC